MAVTYKNNLCSNCHGTLVYLKKERAMECIYCGSRFNREEEYDGLYTIKNVVKTVLENLAYDRLEDARKDLVECEKIASGYVGTTIAEICYRVFLLETPGACAQSEMRSVVGQLQHYYEKLREKDTGISPDEEELYDSFERAGNAFGVLIYSYAFMKLGVRLNYVLKMFDAGTSYSQALNEKLLNYALKNKKTGVADQILNNPDNLNCRETLLFLLRNYKDSDKKTEYIRILCGRAELHPDDAKLFQKYLLPEPGDMPEIGEDGPESKTTLYECAVHAQAAPAIEFVERGILQSSSITEEQIVRVYTAFSSLHPKDSELYELITRIYKEHSGKTANKEMELLLDSGLYIKLKNNVVRIMVGRREWSVRDRISMLDKSEQCHLDMHDNNAILSEILLRIRESADTRIALALKLISYMNSISTSTAEEYLLKCSLDGNRKPEIIKALLQAGLNVGFITNSINQYLQYSNDSTKVKKAILELFTDHGYIMEDKFLLGLACGAIPSNTDEIINMISKALDNGSRMDPKVLTDYLENTPTENINSTIIAMFIPWASGVSDTALARYLLCVNADQDNKAQISYVLAERNGRAFGTSQCTFSIMGADITCNLFQAYLFCSPDASETMSIITDYMKNSGAKLNPDLIINGVNTKFKAYVKRFRGQLSPDAIRICEENDVFKWYF